MYIIRNKQTHEPKSVFLESHNNQRVVQQFSTPRQAKQFMRARRLKKRDNEIIFMTSKEMGKL